MKRIGAIGIFILLFSTGLSLLGEILCDAHGKPIPYAGKFHPASITLGNPSARSGEFRGVWIATVENLDFPPHRSAADFKRDYCAMLDRIAAANFNAVIFQIRPNADAFYASKIVPWSEAVTGTAGMNPGIDPLPFMISEAHRRRLEFHAWLNPYRVHGKVAESKAKFLKKLPAGSFARNNPQLVLESADGKKRLLFFNPGEPAVIRHFCSVVEEIVSKYPVDAIHLDDYFYPYEEIGAADDGTYRNHAKKGVSKGDWRRGNTTVLVQSVRKVIDTVNARTGRKVRFGISPFGIWANKSHLAAGSLTGGKECYFNLYADVRSWVRNGYMDYVVPQIYWPFAHQTAAYACLVDWWSQCVAGTRCKLYIGMAPYRLGSPMWGEKELINQMRYNRANPEVSGAVFFSYRHLFGNRIQPGAARLLRYLKISR